MTVMGRNTPEAAMAEVAKMAVDKLAEQSRDWDGGWTGQTLHAAWVAAPGSDCEMYWARMNTYNVARWENLAARLNARIADLVYGLDEHLHPGGQCE